MKKILVTGSNGQLGNALREAASTVFHFEMLYADIDTFDLTDKRAVYAFFEKNKVDYVLNCAAYTAVDQAEEDETRCELVNRQAIKNIGEAAITFQVKVIHISTDYVFDGTNYRPYIETDPTCPVSVYGKTKLAGEKALLEICPDAVIIRTSWLYSEFGNNFVKTMIRLGKEKDSLNVIFDQVGTPTYAGDLASAMLSIVNSDTFIPGIYHFSNEGVCSWYDFSLKIHQLAGISCRVFPVETKDFPTKAVRPHYSVLNKTKIKNTYQLIIPHWEASLKEMISHLNK
ncbi:MAG: dTDP-4-dehydrorhamnose reductase [Massilibacteroides sp.]|nr:dTDP-4-dehydrorhamnose reductase [Massilibacteroides sp.]MDD3062643.1 dTDP-4-dehydrorhamnose reductase [Massilibacteroides sp.]MDD4115837.1 dTDP-4-dehydrorhamnose reductase [Massilibacteroides sp.]MDD4659528.1 dTDP-4-dehydrorhamnose reductase [Massilibacteroides sp.]